MTDISARQAQVLRAVQTLRGPQGLPPTIREVADSLGISTSTAHAHLLQLRRRDLVDWRAGRQRTLKVR